MSETEIGGCSYLKDSEQERLENLCNVVRKTVQSGLWQHIGSTDKLETLQELTKRYGIKTDFNIRWGNDRLWHQEVEKISARITQKGIQETIKKMNEKLDSMEDDEDSDEDEIFKEDIELSEKHKLKSDLKSKLKHKFKLGQFYSLKFKPKHSNYGFKCIFQVKQLVWTMDDTPVCGLVVKQVDGPSIGRQFLNVSDCKNLHIKYEQGLQIMSMHLQWAPVKNFNN